MSAEGLRSGEESLPTLCPVPVLPEQLYMPPQPPLWEQIAQPGLTPISAAEASGLYEPCVVVAAAGTELVVCCHSYSTGAVD